MWPELGLQRALGKGQLATKEHCPCLFPSVSTCLPFPLDLRSPQLFPFPCSRCFSSILPCPYPFPLSLLAWKEGSDPLCALHRQQGITQE